MEPLEVRIMKLAMRLKDLALEERDKASDPDLDATIHEHTSEAYRQAARLVEELLPEYNQ